MSSIGDRIGAICGRLDEDPNDVRVFGFGVYAGDEVPPPEVTGPFGPVSHKNPKLVLDDGQIVFGCECWWGDEERVKRTIEDAQAQGYQTTAITVDVYRARAGKKAGGEE